MAAEAFTQWLVRHKGLGWILLVVVLLFWLWRGELYQARVDAPAAEPVPAAEAYHVEVMTLDAEPYQPGVMLQGQLLPLRSLILRARAGGTLIELPRLGQRVSEGDRLLTLSDDGRTVKLAQAEAEHRLRQAEVTAAARLWRKQMIAETNYLALQSAAAMAQAELAEARLALSHTRIEAPFAGSIDALPVERGHFVQTGDALLTLVDVSTLKLTAAVPQQQVAGLAPGLPVTAELLDGRELQGELVFVAQSADAATRSFALEARLDNPRGWRVAGASAGLRIALPARPAHRLSPALLALDDNGRPGVHIVDEQNRMQRVPVTLLSITPDEAWIGGLPQPVRIITRGAGFVIEGNTVRVRDAEPVR
ncbi:efflux RND transporter periplasmic adaptor subunit [Oceanisphaera psychrotolerans]|uniref:Efflux transporter periplasmic adaptor subunit n=1 Tax=Oceanisphaera psychrotolerans TaxID=1414654 RepID=A0A1J4QI60_9GAMM|nr:efflux RND transporter periplasmic adaptor subunit [Oceanisphaera psychrotolerans]OIN12761.1 efflux transporter periplasmic adaptor subunit [Oceanisphaera psychrotolerans]